MIKVSQRVYKKDEVAFFFRVKEPFGRLSNMASGMPIFVATDTDTIFTPSSEALYQAARFPSSVECQKKIIEAKSGFAAKLESKPYREGFTRPDWEDVKVNVMRWAIGLKLHQNPSTFGAELLSTGDKPIVEKSSKDQFWGCFQIGDEFVGCNVLGRLLMELRQQYVEQGESYKPPSVLPLDVVILGQKVIDF